MTLTLPQVGPALSAEKDGDPLEQFTGQEFAAISRWLELAIVDTAAQAKDMIDKRRKSTIVHANHAQGVAQFEAEIRGYDVLINWQRAMKAIIDQALMTAEAQGEKQALGDKVN